MSDHATKVYAAAQQFVAAKLDANKLVSQSRSARCYEASNGHESDGYLITPRCFRPGEDNPAVEDMCENCQKRVSLVEPIKAARKRASSTFGKLKRLCKTNP